MWRIVGVIMGLLAGDTDIRLPFSGSQEGITSNRLYCLSPLYYARHPLNLIHCHLILRMTMTYCSYSAPMIGCGLKWRKQAPIFS